MPELPEVETLRKGLQQYLVGHRIKSLDIRTPSVFSGDIQNVIDSNIILVKRFGKGLVIELDNGYSLAIHVKMTGQLIYGETNTTTSEKLPNKYTHVIFHLDRGHSLYFNDMRRFGWIKIIQTDQIASLPFFKNLGREPLTNLTLDHFSQILLASKAPIKSLLMDQKRIAGIGNIYANDALYLAQILPTRHANSLSISEQKTLFAAIEEVLKKGLQYGGASERTFMNVLGQSGSYQNHFLIYGQQGKICKRCGRTIVKTVLAGRGTYYCPGCQR